MPINTLQYAALFQTELDKQAVQTATSGWMEENAGDVIYNGGRDIKIPELTLQGLGDYDRDEGQPIGSVGFAYRTYTMSQDRGRKFRLDENDINETNFGTAAARVMSEFQRTQVVPEIDAYRYSKIANLAGTKSVDTITAANVMPTLYNQLYALANAGVDINNIIVTISYPLFAMINMSGDINRNITVSDFQQGSVTLKIRDLDGAKLIPVSFPFQATVLRPLMYFATERPPARKRAASLRRRMRRLSTGSSAPAALLSPSARPTA